MLFFVIAPPKHVCRNGQARRQPLHLGALPRKLGGSAALRSSLVQMGDVGVWGSKPRFSASSDQSTVEAIRPSRERGLEPAYICPYKNVQSTLVQIGNLPVLGLAPVLISGRPGGDCVRLEVEWKRFLETFLETFPGACRPAGPLAHDA